MEFFHRESRSIGSSPLSQNHRKKHTKVGLALLALHTVELEKPESDRNPHIVFKHTRLTENISQKQQFQEIYDPNPFSPCFLYSLRLDTPPCDNISSKTGNLAPNSASRTALRGEINGLKSTPLPGSGFQHTVCVKHGEASLLPLEYIKTLPEYTCTTWWSPIFKEIHRLEDCVLEIHNGD